VCNLYLHFTIVGFDPNLGRGGDFLWTQRRKSAATVYISLPNFMK